MAQNAWQRAQQQRTNEKQISTAQEVYDQMIQTMRLEVVRLKNQVIEELVKEELGVDVLLDITEIKTRGFMACATDGSEVFHWDNHPRIYFAPIDMQVVDGTARPVQKWQRIPIPSEPGEPDLSEREAAEQGQESQA